MQQDKEYLEAQLSETVEELALTEEGTTSTHDALLLGSLVLVARLASRAGRVGHCAHRPEGMGACLRQGVG